jgi:excisionase family DNA binding protein
METGRIQGGQAVNDEIWTPKQTAAFLQVELSTIYAWVHLKKIPYVKVGGLLRFWKSEIIEWLNKRRGR